MKKIKLKENTHLYPMPVTLVGTRDGERVNFSTIAWITRANYKPPLIVAAINSNHLTAMYIEKNKEFSVNIPNKDLLLETDFCGIAKGKQVDKSKHFTIFYGDLENAPMIEECPITMECKLIQVVEQIFNNLYIGEIVGAYSEKKYLTEEKPDIHKIKPFVLTMPDNQYWTIGKKIGKAWSIGKDLKTDKEK